MENYHIAVLDIGKTNKKILIYDQDLMIVDQRYTRIPEIEKDDIFYDDVESLKSWIISTFSELSGLYNIRVISTSAHGATYSLVDEDGNSVVPQIAYNTDPGDDFHREFYNVAGDPVDLQVSTATPNFNLLINPAKGIYFTKKLFPEKFSQAVRLLLYPQFFGFWLTGQACADPTYTGNHTYLWDFEKRDWSNVADKLEIRRLLPKSFKNPWESLGKIKPEIVKRTGLGSDTIVTVGIHDSNASMLPYLISMKEPFLLNSTGTWCVIMNEKEKIIFAPDELGKVVFYNQNAFWKPVKTAIFLGGMEFEHYSRILTKIHGRTDFPKFNNALTEEIIRKTDKFILPSVARGIGQFPQSAPRIIENGEIYTLAEIESGSRIPGFFMNYEEALIVLNLSLAIQTKVSFDRADKTYGLQVFTEGGFSKNDTYNSLMTAFYPDSAFYLTSLKEASAYGAAICGKVAFENVDIHSVGQMIEIEKIPIRAFTLPGIENYYKKFLSLI